MTKLSGRLSASQISCNQGVGVIRNVSAYEERKLAMWNQKKVV